MTAILSRLLSWLWGRLEDPAHDLLCHCDLEDE